MTSTVMEAMDTCAAKFAALPALRSKIKGQWQTVTWAEYHAQIRLVARAMMALGLAPKEGLAIIGNNCPQWFIANNAAIYSGALPAGIYATNSPEQCHYIAENCDATIAVVENSEQLGKFQVIAHRLPKLKAIIVMTERVDTSVNSAATPQQIVAWKDLPALAQQVSEEALDSRIKAQTADDICTLIYTSGTTGNPKGVMLSHRNLTWSSKTAIDFFALTSDDRVISYLPLSHIAEQIFTLHMPMYSGGCTSFAESLDLLGDNLREVRPTRFLGVPRVWEKIQAKIVAAGQASPPQRKKIVAWARKQGLAGGYAKQQGQSLPLFFGVANKLVFSKVRQQLGFDRCLHLLTGAAPISLDTLEFFLSLGLPVCEIYGMSESSGLASISLANDCRTGKLGRAIPGTEMRIAADGEILLRGPHVFAGYLKKPAATSETIDSEGWLHSGDLGDINSEGYLQITGRKKDIIITSGGENIAPQLLEGKIKAIAAISQVVVIGDQRKYLTALITLNAETLDSELVYAGSPACGAAEAASCDKMLAYLQSQIDDVNKSLAQVQTIKKFTVLTADFSIEGDELTPTMKVKRNVVSIKYEAEIAAMY
ncbi:MAG: AMP-binding protein [Gammaproteobacteria bacterium]|nr:AMP-binding protein [Gammaproteobacteria bacterium]MBQ0841157.1 AMP-binding protein [Gammaproteobacteria bacterium]